MIRFCRAALVLVLVTAVLPKTAAAQVRTIEFETTEVTAPDLAITPDGEWLIFTLLGHLFRLPVEGGTAEQLTFGPYFDADIVLSPDGERVAFVSDRDGSQGNIFMLELETGALAQVTRERWAGRPTFTPDGGAIVYLSYDSPGNSGSTWVPAVVRRVGLSDDESETVAEAPQLFTSTFFLPDGRLAWAVREREPNSQSVKTRLEAVNADGTAFTLRVVEGTLHQVEAARRADGVIARRRPNQDFSREELVFVPFSDADVQVITEVPRTWVLRTPPRVAQSADGEWLVVGREGKLWKVGLADGVPAPMGFTAHVTMQVQEPVEAPTWTAPSPGGRGRPRTINDPQVAPDGRSVVFTAAGDLWRQALDSTPAVRLFTGASWPTISPDGRQLAFIHETTLMLPTLMLLDLESGESRTPASGGFIGQPMWSPDGERIVAYQPGSGFSASRVVAIHVASGETETLTETGRFSFVWPQPHFAPDGQSVFYTAVRDGQATLLRLRSPNAEVEAVTALSRHVGRALVSPDGKWLAFRRNWEIWIAPLTDQPVRDTDVRQFSAEGGYHFAFTPDGTAIVYAAGNRVWRRPVPEGEREAIPIQVELSRTVPRPVLLRSARILDFARGAFSDETSLLIEGGRIRRVGTVGELDLPTGVEIIDAEGRYAIPGLFDLHVHLAGTQMEALLAYGITSIRSLADGIFYLHTLMDRSEASGAPLPRIFYAGQLMEGTGLGFGDLALHLANEDEARRYVRRQHERGVQFIKAYPSLPWELQRATADEARAAGLPVVAHGQNVEQITKGVTMGYAFFEHVPAPQPVHGDVLQLLQRAGTRWTPTLAPGIGPPILFGDEPQRRDDPKLWAFAPAWAPFYLSQVMANASAADAQDPPLLRVLRSAYEHGVRIQAGTDASASVPFMGSSLHWELELFVRAGIPPLDVLRIASQEAAVAMGAGAELGTLEVGKLADIVLLDANPLEDIKNTQSIWRVIKGGWVFDPEKLRPERN